MGRTLLSTREIGSVQRNDLDITTTGEAVVRKLIAGTNVSFSSTGVDAGTGDVTINVTGGAGDAVLASSQSFTGVNTFNSTVSAVANVAKGQIVTGTLTATANTDKLVGLYVAPTFTNGAFVVDFNFAAEFVGDVKLTSSTTVNGNSTGHLILDNGRGLKTKNASGVVRDMFKLFSDNNFYVDNVDGDIVIRGPSLATRIAMQGANVGVSGIGTPTARLHLPAGTTSANTAPLKIDTGSVLSTPEAGTIEHQAPNFFGTSETTSGRGLIPLEQHFRLTAAGSNISTIANFFGSTSNISLVSGAFYEIEIFCYFLKNTAGTVTWTFTNSAAPTSQNINFEMSPITGLVAPPGTATMLMGQFYNDNTAAKAFTTGSLSNAANHYAYFKIFLTNSTGTSFKIQLTSNTGTVTPGINSRWICRRVPVGNTGTFAA